MPEEMEARDLAQALERVAALCDSLDLSPLSPRLEACRALAGRTPRIEVGVLGSFKTGKSSFLNSLAQRPVLPVGAIPVTTVLTRLSYGPIGQASVSYTGGRVEAIPMEDVRRFVSESDNPGNHRGVAAVDIELPGLRPFEGLCFVDTPGLGTVHAHNTDASLGWLPQAGAALIAISAERPLSGDDVRLIRDLTRATPRLALLLTKVDLVGEHHTGEIIDFITDQLRRLTGTTLPVFPFSTLNNTAHHREQLHDRFLGPLTSDRTRAIGDIVKHKLRTLIDDASDLIAVGLAAAQRDEAGRTRLRAQIVDEKRGMETIRRELQIATADLTSRTLPVLLELLKPHQDALQERLGESYRTASAAWKENLWHYARSYEDWLGIALATEITRICNQERAKLLAPLRMAQEHVTWAADTVRQSLSSEVERVLGVTLQRTVWDVPVSEPGSPDVSVSPSFDIQVDLLWFLVPMPVFRPLVDRHFRRRLHWEAEKHLSRLAAQWSELINEEIHRMAMQAEELVRRQVGMIGHLLDASPSSVPELEAARAQLQSLRAMAS